MFSSIDSKSCDSDINHIIQESNDFVHCVWIPRVQVNEGEQSAVSDHVMVAIVTDTATVTTVGTTIEIAHVITGHWEVSRLAIKGTASDTSTSPLGTGHVVDDRVRINPVKKITQ